MRGSLKKNSRHWVNQLAKGLRYERKERKIRPSVSCSIITSDNGKETLVMSPLAVVGGQETSLFLRGQNLNIPGTKIHCTHGYLSKEVPGSACQETIHDERSLVHFKINGSIVTTVLAKEIEPESIRFGEETRVRSEHFMAIVVATILNPLLRWRWIDSSRFDQKHLIRKHALGHRTARS
ncbi:Squamosa promoter-binding-like protein 15 [Camellia lanceoleosa]|uniref:Squamosa promoter-binding-like protein 15 n=1 Tax=Camellia lanceoleosa TaxID=1840588 RepID=A0ACC0I5M6_9ERIC|nr:Squamosa promoter-binding-like protein 15 [Camellia lanceoleosa]